MTPRKRIAVIGAGGSGLVSAKSCLEGGFDVVCYEKTNDLGGLWVYRKQDEEGHPSVMSGTVINTSKEMSSFSDFPPPDHFPNFMHNRYMREYLLLYAKNFDVVQHIRLRHEVLKISRADDYEHTGRWRLLVKDVLGNKEIEEEFDGVMMCAGHHVYPITPDLPGLSEFQGKKQHSHSLKTTEGMEDKEVLVVGSGNSGVDAAVEISNVAKQVYLSTRSGFYLIGKTYRLGLPLDTVLNRRIFYHLPKVLSNILIEKCACHKLMRSVKPKYSIMANHPTINDYLPIKLVCGTIQMKSNVHHFTKHGVVFEHEDKEYPLDAVVMATGYSYKLPFFENNQVKVDDSACELYKFVFPPNLRHPSLAFIGIVQPMGAVFPCSELQARWYVQIMKGNRKLPSASVMLQEIRAREAFHAKHYVKAVRHLTEVSWVGYMNYIASEVGAKPNLFHMMFSDPVLFLQNFYGPCLPYQFRLTGPYQWAGARRAILQYSKRVSAPFNTKKVLLKECSRNDQKMPKSQLWFLFLIPFFMYIMLLVL